MEWDEFAWALVAIALHLIRTRVRLGRPIPLIHAGMADALIRKRSEDPREP
jgi:hypothetical protein